MSSYVCTFSPDASTPAVNTNFVTLKAGDAETLTLLVEGFETADSITSIKLYAKLDVTDADNATNTIALTAVLTTPTRDPNARTATFSLSALNTVDLLRGRVFRVEVIATRSAVPYTRTVMYGMIAASYPGSTVVAPSDEAYLRALGDATVLTALGFVAYGGTGITSYALGDMLYATATTTLAKLSGNTTATKKWLSQTGTGSVSAAPAWAVVTSADISDATSTNTVSRVVIRDASGNFAAGTITASLTGNVTGNVTGALTGNASTATALATGRTIAITGDLTYTSPSFDGTGNVTAAGTLATVNINTGAFGSSTAIPVITVNGKGLVTAVSTAAVIAPAGTLSGTTLSSNVVTSSLTSVGVLASPHMTSAVVDSGGFTVTSGTSALQAITGTTLSLSGTLTMTATASKLVPGATSFSHRNNADSADNLLITDAGAVTTRSTLTVTAGGLTVSSGTSALQAMTATTGVFSSTVTTTGLTISTAVGKIIPGATSLSHRNNADSADNLLITDAGAVTTRSTLTVTAGGFTVTSGTSALQALTATTGVFSSTVKATSGYLFATNPIVTPSGTTTVIQPNGSGGGVVINDFASTRNNFSITDAGAATIFNGLTITQGGLTVSAGTTAVQALTATTGVLSSTLSALSVAVTGGSSGAGKMWFSSGDGLVLQGKAGSDKDFAVANPGFSAYVLYTPTGTLNLVAGGTLTAASTITSTAGNFVLGINNAGVLFKAVSGVDPNILCDSSSNIQFKMASAAGTGIRIIDSSSNPVYTLTPGGTLDFPNGGQINISGTKVVSARRTGWTAATGTATRTTFATSTVTTQALAEAVKALIDDGIAAGWIGA